tara:strand:- start:637 stop:1956 length:1320 start_codon:yes stop_codon:yes gene_type:complete
MLYRIIFCLFIFITHNIKCQSFDIYDDIIKLKDYNYNTTQNPNIHAFYAYPKSVKIIHPANDLLDPIIKLNSSETLQLSFDILESEAQTYAYTFIHCNAKWEYSEIMQLDYLDGFFHNYINEYQYSFNTTTDYINYTCDFPNTDVNFKKSGNYIILVYNPETNTPIITKRFMIYEEVLDLTINVKKATLVKDMKDKHEIDFIVEGHKKLGVIDPKNELTVIIQKNDDWNDIINKCQPNFIYQNKLEYDFQGELSFFAGNEYRDFDIKSLRYYGKNIKSITQNTTQGAQNYMIQLEEDYPQNSNYYNFKYDINGKYILATSERKNKNSEGEYALIKFILNKKKQDNKDIYIYGELTNWDFLPEAKMIYNAKDEKYYSFLYLKQGYYNYQYVIKDNNQIITLDNNYHETRNQYSIYIYHTPLWGNYNRLVGVGKSSSNALN